MVNNLNNEFHNFNKEFNNFNKELFLIINEFIFNN